MLRANFLSHDPDSQASVTADLGVELQPATPPMDLVSRSEQHGLKPEEFLPLLDCIAPTTVLLPRMRAWSQLLFSLHPVDAVFDGTHMTVWGVSVQGFRQRIRGSCVRPTQAAACPDLASVSLAISTTSCFSVRNDLPFQDHAIHRFRLPAQTCL